MSSISPTSNKVPYFLLQLDDGQSRALFTVPANAASALVVHPVLCRGSSFHLDLHDEGRKRESTAFLSTVFFSPYPEETARQIAERLAIRIGSPSPVVSQLFGFR
jgi:hypothetical protein